MERRRLRPSLRFAILARDGYRCQYCGASAPAVTLHIDHIVPVAKGGTDDPENLITACETCNLGKRTRIVSRPRLELSANQRHVLEALEVAHWEAVLDQMDVEDRDTSALSAAEVEELLELEFEQEQERMTREQFERLYGGEA